jgi:hypothetical protein
MRCTWKVERIELPEAKAPDLAPAGSAGPLGLGSSAFGSPGSGSPGAGGPLAALSQLTTNPAALVGDGGVSSFATTMKESTGGMAGIEALAMSIVYPQLKPMLEASIRKLTVSVNWKEGLQQRDITIVQYVTRPMKPAFSPSAMGSGASPLVPGIPGIPGLQGLGSQAPGGRQTSLGRAP